MQVFIRGPGNCTVVLNVDRRDTVLMLKQMMWARTCIPVERMWMECGGRILHDEATLEESRVVEESTVWCHLRVGGEGCEICSRNRRGI